MLKYYTLKYYTLKYYNIVFYVSISLSIISICIKAEGITCTYSRQNWTMWYFDRALALWTTVFSFPLSYRRVFWL